MSSFQLISESKTEIASQTFLVDAMFCLESAFAFCCCLFSPANYNLWRSPKQLTVAGQFMSLQR